MTDIELLSRILQAAINQAIRLGEAEAEACDLAMDVLSRSGFEIESTELYEHLRPELRFLYGKALNRRQDSSVATDRIVRMLAQIRLDVSSCRLSGRWDLSKGVNDVD